jgi:type II secretory pathway component PulF
MSSSLTLEDIQHLSDEVRHLVNAGMPLEESLAAAGRGRGDRLQKLTQTISDGLSQGRSLQDIVEQQTVGVPRMLASAVGAGVQSGDLGLTIELMGDFAADVVELRNKLLQSAAYPLTIVAVAGLLVVLVVQHALERFLETIVSWNIKANPVLVTLLEWNRDMPGWVLLIPLAGLILFAFWTMSGRAAAMTFRGPERLLLLLPGVGALVRDLRYYTLSRMLSLLTERGLPLQDALRLAGGASGSTRLEHACREMAARIERGASVSDERLPGISQRNRLPSLLQVCLKQVEHNEARMVHRLRSVADFYRNRLQRNSAWVRLLMPVVLFIVIGGGCVLLYATMIFWPVTELYRNLGN